MHTWYTVIHMLCVHGCGKQPCVQDILCFVCDLVLALSAFCVCVYTETYTSAEMCMFHYTRVHLYTYTYTYSLYSNMQYFNV